MCSVLFFFPHIFRNFVVLGNAFLLCRTCSSLYLHIRFHLSLSSPCLLKTWMIIVLQIFLRFVPTGHTSFFMILFFGHPFTHVGFHMLSVSLAFDEASKPQIFQAFLLYIPEIWSVSFRLLRRVFSQNFKNRQRTSLFLILFLDDNDHRNVDVCLSVKGQRSLFYWVKLTFINDYHQTGTSNI